jgi:hypothetical protein
MNGAELLQTLLAAGDKVDSQWSMYIVVHLGLFWFFFLVHRPLLIVERILAVFAYLVFAYLNGTGLINSYAFLEAVRRDLVTKFGRDLNAIPDTLQVLSKTSYAGAQDIIMITHGGGVVLVLLLFITRNVMIRRYFRSYPEQLGRQSGAID